MIFVLTMLFILFNDRKNKNHRSLLITRYSLLITWNTNTLLLFRAPKNYLNDISPAARGRYTYHNEAIRGAIPFWFYLVSLRLVSIFLNVGHVEISCGFLPTRFLSLLIYYYKTVLLSKKGDISSSI